MTQATETAETTKKKRSLEEQIAAADAGNVPELARLQARERARLAEKALTKRQPVVAVQQLQMALGHAKKLLTAEQLQAFEEF